MAISPSKETSVSPSTTARPYDADFINDASIDDGTIMAPGEKFVKSWTLANGGANAWPAGTRLIYVGGERMGATTGVDVAALACGEQTVVSVDMVAPEQPGLKNSYWRLVLPDGTRFGDHLWCEINVVTSD
ncbi:hypothetical protein SYNPS1DRAFT_20011, partial [Syncephalis pseudoplumigaleata]